MKDILRLYKHLNKLRGLNKTIGVQIELSGLSVFLDSLEYYDFEFSKDKNIIELSSLTTNDSFVVDLSKLIACTQHEDEYGTRYYHLKFESFVMDVFI